MDRTSSPDLAEGGAASETRSPTPNSTDAAHDLIKDEPNNASDDDTSQAVRPATPEGYRSSIISLVSGGVSRVVSAAKGLDSFVNSVTTDKMFCLEELYDMVSPPSDKAQWQSELDAFEAGLRIQAHEFVNQGYSFRTDDNPTKYPGGLAQFRRRIVNRTLSPDWQSPMNEDLETAVSDFCSDVRAKVLQRWEQDADTEEENDAEDGENS